MTESPEDRLEEIHLYERVAEEIEQGTQVKGLWLKALVESDNDQEKAAAVYAKLRVKMLQDTEMISDNVSFGQSRSLKYPEITYPESSVGIAYDCAELKYMSAEKDSFGFIFPNGEEICLMYNEHLNTFPGAGFKIRTGGDVNYGWPIQTTLFQVKLAHEADKLSKILASKIKKYPRWKGSRSNYGKWDALVKAIMICRTRDEVASLFHDAYSQISKD